MLPYDWVFVLLSSLAEYTLSFKPYLVQTTVLIVIDEAAWEGQPFTCPLE